MRCVSLAIVLAACVPGASAQAQDGVEQPPRVFDVASIKPNTDGGNTYQRASPNGTMTLGNNTLRNIIRTAHGLQGAQVVGGPDWLDRDRFDVVAKAGRPFTQDEGRAMLRALLAERFGLVAHTETRPMAVYIMRVDNRERGLGSRLRPSSLDCDAMLAASKAGGTAAPAAPDGRLPCVLDVRFAAGSVAGIGVSMTQLAHNLMNAVGRVVVDETGLSGAYDLELTFVPDPGLAAPGSPAAGVDPSAPSLFTALQEQLGLRLEPGRAPVPVLVVDRAERPTAD
jgi:uncharacterized protein (TIGR03435 family)